MSIKSHIDAFRSIILGLKNVDIELIMKIKRSSTQIIMLLDVVLSDIVIFALWRDITLWLYDGNLGCCYICVFVEVFHQK